MIAGLLRELSWPELRHHPWRHGAALLAIVLGVALAFSVQLINASALSEFSAAVRAVNGAPDFELRGPRDGFDEALYARVARHPLVAVASPVIEVDTIAFDARGERVALKIVGLDALVAAPLAPSLMPRPADGAPRLAMLGADAIFLNERAAQRLGVADARRATLRVQKPDGAVELAVQGRIAAPGAPLAVMDIAAVQSTFGWLGRLGRIDVQLRPGADRARVLEALALPPGVRAAAPDEAAQRVSNVSRAYRVNLTVLALVALFTGAFLVYSILALSVAQRQPQFALLGVLGLSGGERMRWVIAESALLGLVGGVLGLALGTALAALALKLLAGDLGGGYFPGVVPALQFDVAAAIVYLALGVVAAVLGGWLPARSARALAPAQALKGLGGSAHAHGVPAWAGPALIGGGVLLALAPPVADVPLAAYLSVACLMLGGIACVPPAVGALLASVAPPTQPLALLAVERVRHDRHSATIAVAGVVASLALSIALTVMVASFRESVTSWLDAVLPADLYVRAGSGTSAGDVVTLPTSLPQCALGLPGVARATAQRVTSLQLVPQRPAVALIARPLDESARALPLIGATVPAPPGAIGVWVSEAVATLYGATPGTPLALPLGRGAGDSTPVVVLGVWRDYARQHGAIVMRDDDYRRLTGDQRINDLALWLAPGSDVARVQRDLRALSSELGLDGALLEMASVGELRATSLRIFDRSFAVTYWLQAVAIGIGLFGVAASTSAQVLARRKEFGLLSHLGLTRAQVLAVVASEGMAWTAAGALVGLALGLAVSVVLVKVVNPQSFHWTMDLLVPWARLAWLCASVVLAGTATAWFAARQAARGPLALTVKEDW